MELYLVPIGRALYQLYCETPHVVAAPDQPGGFFARLWERFRLVLDRIERERERPPLPAHDADWLVRFLARVRQRVVRWTAERITEQRLLWQMRGAVNVAAVVPDDLDSAAALATIRRMLARDASRHGRWLIVNAVVFIASGILAPIPGPNLIAYYFAFRVVGHFLSRQGARDGLRSVEWEIRPSAELAELRRAISLAPADRDRRVSEIAERLKLPRLTAFFHRTALPTT